MFIPNAFMNVGAVAITAPQAALTSLLSRDLWLPTKIFQRHIMSMFALLVCAPTFVPTAQSPLPLLYLNPTMKVSTGPESIIGVTRSEVFMAAKKPRKGAEPEEKSGLNYGEVLLNFLNPLRNPNSLALYAIILINVLDKLNPNTPSSF